MIDVVLVSGARCRLFAYRPADQSINQSINQWLRHLQRLSNSEFEFPDSRRKHDSTRDLTSNYFHELPTPTFSIDVLHKCEHRIVFPKSADKITTTTTPTQRPLFQDNLGKPLPSQNPIISCLIWNQTSFTFQVLAYPGCPGKEAVEWV